MAQRIKPEKVEELIRRFDAGTLTKKERALVRRIMEECVRMGLGGKGPSKDDGYRYKTCLPGLWKNSSGASTPRLSRKKTSRSFGQ